MSSCAAHSVGALLTKPHLSIFSINNVLTTFSRSHARSCAKLMNTLGRYCSRAFNSTGNTAHLTVQNTPPLCITHLRYLSSLQELSPEAVQCHSVGMIVSFSHVCISGMTPRACGIGLHQHRLPSFPQPYSKLLVLNTKSDPVKPDLHQSFQRRFLFNNIHNLFLLKAVLLLRDP